MIKHVVFFKFKAEITEPDRRSAIALLRSLPEKIDCIRDFEVGEDVLKSPRSWDIALIATFDDLAALDVYQRHDDHQPVVRTLRALCEALAAVDYEC